MSNRYVLLDPEEALKIDASIDADEWGHLLDTVSGKIIVSDCHTYSKEDASLLRNFFPLVSLLNKGEADETKATYVLRLNDEDEGYDLVERATGNIVVSDCNIYSPEDASLSRNFYPLVKLLNQMPASE